MLRAGIIALLVLAFLGWIMTPAKVIEAIDENDRLKIACVNFQFEDAFVHEIVVNENAILIYENPGERPVVILNDACKVEVFLE